MNFKEFDVSNRGNMYELIFQDYLTKWPAEIFPVADRTAKTMANCIAELVRRHRVPACIIRDRAAEFLSDVFKTPQLYWEWSNCQHLEVTVKQMGLWRC